MNRFLKFLVCLLLLLPCCVAGGKPVLLLLQPQSWGLLAFTATLVLLLLHATWRSPGCWDLRAVLLLAIWCLLLPVAFYRSSVWLAHVTFCVAAAIAGKSLQPSRRTQLFVVLPALLAGLPPFLNKPLQKWLSEQIIQQTSVAASLQGIWHHREGTLLTASSGSVDLGPILNSPLSISGLLVVMCVWMGFRRLPTAQILVAVPLAACVAVMLPVGSCLIAIRDLADGGQLMSVLLWLLLLAGTLLLLYSATLLSKLLTNAITPPDDRFQEHIEENPLVQLWDRIIGGRTSEYAEPIRFLSENRKRLAPTVRPIEFLKDWFFSRRPRLLLQSVPALLALCALLMANGSLASRQNSILSRYQAQVELSRKNADLDQQEICLRGLASLAPADVGGRLRLAEFLWEQRGRETGWKEYERLAQLEGAGGAAAHLWIARHAMSWRPLRELSDEEIIQHLRRALESGEYAAEAHALLARIYLRNNEVTLAGQHLRKAADADIRYLDELIMFHRQQGIPMPAEERIPKRVRELELMVEQRPDDVSVRLDFATLLDALGDHRKAMLTVSEGRRLNDSEVLREAAAELLLNAARSEISTAVVGGDQCLLAVRNALQLNPKNAEAPRLAALLRLEGAAFAGSIDDALLYWREQVRETESDVAIRCLALLAFAAGEPEESLESFKRLRQPTFGDADVRIAAHIQLRQSQEALSFAQAFSENLSKMPSAAAKLAAAQLLSRARAFDLAMQCLELPNPVGGDLQILAVGKARTALDELDVLMGYPGFYPAMDNRWKPQLQQNAADKVAALLEVAIQSTELTMRTADRLYILSQQGGELREIALEALGRFRSTRGDVVTLQMAVGAQALRLGNYEDAILWLEQAGKVGAVQEPAYLNNLAVALVRAGREDRYLEALELANLAVQKVPQNHMILATRAEVYLALKQPRPALKDLETALQLRPDYPETLLLLAQACTELGDSDRAEQLRQQAATLQN